MLGVVVLYKRDKKARLELLDTHKVRKVRISLLTKFEKLDIMRAYSSTSKLYHKRRLMSIGGKGEYMFNHEKMAEIIREKGIEQKGLAEKVGISEAMMSFVVRGLKEPSLTVLGRIAHELGVSVAELIIEN